MKIQGRGKFGIASNTQVETEMGHQVKQKNKNGRSRQVAPDKNRSGSFFATAVIQPKLTVNAPGDRYEQEADAVADKVMRMPDKSAMSMQPASVQRKCEECEEEERMQMKEEPIIQRKCSHCEEEEKGKLQRKSLVGTITPVQRKENKEGDGINPSVEQSIRAGRGRGEPLPQETRTFMEERIGSDFSHVKVHTGANAVQLSHTLNAHAFTQGSDIYFNEGKFAPGTDGGKRLLAHELTHVVQQNGAGNRISRIPKEDEIPDRYNFTANCGWIDWSHAQPGLSRNLIARVQSASDALRTAGGTSTAGQLNTPSMQSSAGGIVLSSTSLSIQLLRPLSSQEVLSVALSIFKRISLVFETLQEWTDPIGHSSFSQEDLPSNLIGFYRAVMNYSRSDIEDFCGLVTADNPIRRTVSNSRFCSVVDISSSLQEYRRDHNFERNRTFRPVDAVGPWPSQLSSISTTNAENLYEIRTIQAQRGPHNTHRLCPIYRVEGLIGETGLFVISIGGHEFTAADNLRVKPTYRFRPTTHGAYGHTTLIEVEPYGASDEAQFRTQGISSPIEVPENVLVCLSSHSNPI